MRKSILGLSAIALAAFATPAMADDAAPTPEFTVNGSVTLASDYRFRGISQTNKDLAIQGGITLSHKSGFYASFWSSNVDGYVNAKGTASQELDLIAGYKHTLSNGLTLDGGVLYYVYPGFSNGSTKSDFFEPYVDVAYTIASLTSKVTVNYSPKQRALALGQTGIEPGDKSRDSVYLAGDFSYAIPNTKFGLTAHIGHSFGPSWLATSTPTNRFNGYTDWNLGANYTWRNLTFAVSYVDTDTKFIVNGNDEAKAAAVASITAAF